MPTVLRTDFVMLAFRRHSLSYMHLLSNKYLSILWDEEVGCAAEIGITEDKINRDLGLDVGAYYLATKLISDSDEVVLN